MWKNAKWLALPFAELEDKKIYHGDLTGRFAYFRCEKQLPPNCTLTLDITANSRYRLWINAVPVLSGPCKGDRFRQYYETVDVTPWLRAGANIFCVQVLYNDPDAVEHETAQRAAICGVVGRQCGHCLAVEGDIVNADADTIDTITTGCADWRVWLDNSFYLKSDEHTQFLGAAIEELDAAQMPIHWKEPDCDCQNWRQSQVLSPLAGDDPFAFVGVVPMFRLCKREIPLLYERKQLFGRCFDRQGESLRLLETGSDIVAVEETAEFIFDAGFHVNAYPRFSFAGGKGARIHITYFEKFGGPWSDRHRSDVRGEITGITDTLTLDGSAICYEPFWVRSFRFVRVTVEAAQETVTVYAPEFLKTGYPLPVQSRIESSAPWVGKLWEICVRTLENCMLETYMDCPYYEQLQYAMDTRLEARYTYCVSSDTALVRKALIDFHYGMQPEGLNAGKAPAAYLQILSTFSLHYIFLLREYAQQADDPALLRLCHGDVDRILDVFDAQIGQDGLVDKLDFWNFVDWNDAWNATGGAPAALLQGPSTIINLMYAYALGEAAALAEQVGRLGLAEEYRQRREKILCAVEQLCWDAAAGLYREGPAFHQYSAHAQAWAVLNGLRKKKAAATLLRTAMEKEDCLRCSFSTAYEWFRALEEAGMFDEMRRELEPWIELLALDCTTCPETPKGARSECHAWSALPLYELIRTVAGIQPQTDGTLLVSPNMMDLPDLRGQAITENGPVFFEYCKNEDGYRQYQITVPAGAKGYFLSSDGKRIPLDEGNNFVKENANS